MLIGFLLRAVMSAAGLWVAAHIVPGIRVDSLSSLTAAALLLTVLTLGLFLLVINAAMLGLVTVFLHGFHVHGFWAALCGSIVVSLVSWIGSTLLPK
jgi:putative membrane protein